MKDISEMSLDELRDHALALRDEVASQKQTISDRDQTIEELNKTNLTLQERNNRLFMEVEQGRKNPSKQDTKDEEPPESLEDFAERTVKEVFN